MKSPVFIFSLPRSGSTLVQRILMAHSGIASFAEPWFLLPLMNMDRDAGTLSRYSHLSTSQAFKEFVEHLPGGETFYQTALKDFCETIYAAHCQNGEMYFIDKTPRYFYIIPQIAEVFPDAKFIFIFRNPCHVYSSVLKTWGGGSFKRLYLRYNDLMDGPKLLAQGYEQYKSRSYAFQYEDFVREPEHYLKEMCDYLELEYEANMLDDFSKQDLVGKYGDPSGVKAYKTIEPKTLEKWKSTFNTGFRKAILKRYIGSMDEADLRIQGYEKKAILDEIDALNSRVALRATLGDVMQYLKTMLIVRVKINLFFARNRKWSRDRYLS